MKIDSLKLFADKLVPQESGCWNWVGKTDGGYGLLQRQGKRYKAHRFAYEMLRGPVPDGLVLDHLCANRVCVNPWHLEAVTRAENTLRAIPSRLARKTHCKFGHELSGTNLRFERSETNGNIRRRCITCTKDAKLRYKERKALNAT